ncbi:MAG: hypothetical protein JNK73_13580 [Bacteroidia bacterium]|nr:hypothetical protein [Bacteroidia bacterium]
MKIKVDRFSLKFALLIMVVLFSGALVAQSTEVKPKEEEDAPKKKVETKLTEVVVTDSLPSSELLNRAIAWVKEENAKYVKKGGTSSGSKAECIASFSIKPKELNPEVDYTGKILMKVVIEVKDSKYRYTVSEIKHVSKSGKVNGGNIDNVVPECGSMVLKDVTWKKMKGEALRNAALVVADLKEGMKKVSTEVKTDEW